MPTLPRWKWIFLRLSTLNWWLIILTIILGTFGIINASSASSHARTITMIFHFLFGFMLMFTIALMPIEWIMRLSVPLYILGLILLVLVLFQGVSAKGAKRWLEFMSIRFQPSEIMKIAVPMVLAWGFHRLNERSQWLKFPLAIAILLLSFLLIARQPDLGTATLIAIGGFFVIYLGGIPWKWLLSSFVVFALSIPAYWHYFMKPYQKDRVMVFLDPTTDPTGKGYHIIQSVIAIGSGGILGKGYQRGTQSQLDFLPEAHTDFVFAVFAEEWGFVGFLTLLIMILLLLQQCIKIVLALEHNYEKLLSGALSLTFFSYVFINMGMVSGILPVVGVPLPFMSYGGTATVINFSMMGLILCCAKSLKEKKMI